MDVCKTEHPGAVMQQKTAQTEDNRRLPLVPSEKNNAAPATRKLRSREIASRYKSGISSTPLSTPTTPRRGPSTSPMPGTSLPKRSQSADRRRPSTPSTRSSVPSSPSSRPSTPSSPSSRSTTPVRDVVTEMHNTSRRLLSSRAPDGLWPSMRSLSSSFQSESVSVPFSKRDKAVTSVSSDRTLKSSANVAAERKRTPLRGRNTSEQSENSKPLENSRARVMDQHRWPAMISGKVSANALSRSVDFTDGVKKSQSSSISSRGISPRRTPASDSAGSGLQHSLSEVARRPAVDGSGRVQRDMSLSVNNPSHLSGRSSSATHPSRTQSLPIQALCRPSSPNKALSATSLARGMLSPSRSRPSTPRPSSLPRSRPSSPVSSSSSTTSRAGVTSSTFNYIVDMRKGKKNASHIEDAYQLRLLCNRVLQWRFVNARADETLSIQKMRAENILYNVWNTTSKLCDFVTMKRIDVQHWRQEMKLAMILNEQMAYLENWAALEREHCNTLSGATEALKASTLCLPVTGGTRADMLSMKNAVSSAVDVMQTMGSSICYVLSKVEGTKALVSELSGVAAKERAMLDECRELLASAAAMQVQEASLRTHLIQLRHDACKLE
ncbi:AUGMIN subunit 8 isoform X2 [Elaeis guineensis]|uniref:AUGMIN subunit 8 isoform X1 n=1 Tax=Elaeis guineensis var. tenera TaxID=51953 RepID=A0A6I9RM56_ELAGV|nr:AUGMIN subunit 8 isoform X1 [Elaeis guineensis]XP_010929175.1 AUGMIN subunit 8 isoform X1 [Elaeis guineensis]